jgi:MFS family permease
MAKYDKRDDDEKSGCCSLNNCLFCCCLPLKPSIVITTISIIISLIIAIILNLIFYDFNIWMFFIFVIYIIVIISLIVLLIGIHKDNIPFMKQFKVVFLLFLIFQTFLMIYDIINRFKDTVIYSEIAGKKIEHTVKNDLSTFIKILLIILAIVNFIILVGYYYATCKYISLVESGEAGEYERRLEENRKSRSQIKN